MRFVPLLLLFLSPTAAYSQAPVTADIVVYGGSASGVAAAVQATRMGKTAVVVEPSKHIGGLTSGGLGYTDSGNKEVIGGISREFYQRVKKHYENPSTWNFGKITDIKGYRPDEDAMWVFEPRVAEKLLRGMLKEAGVAVHEGERIDRKANGVTKEHGRIKSIKMESGKTFAGSMFIDATYEGDLMALAGVSYATGREPNSKFGETLNGVQKAKNVHNHKFIKDVDPFVKPGDKSSGLLFGIEDKLPPDGEGDHRLQAFCFRMCMCLDPNNRVPFAKPEGYNEAKYELLFRNFEAGDMRVPMKPDMMPNGKTDTNNNCAVSTDFIGQNFKYPDTSYAEREKIITDHLTYQKGLMWALQNHPRVPEKIRQEFAKWGMTKDEFTDNGGWPHQIYVRESRRMMSDYVMSEPDCTRKRQVPASVGMGSYNMDSHNCTRYVTDKGFVQNEGDIQVSPGGPYQISYLSIVPKKGECPNLLVPICCSSSHIAYGSIRMEPVFMVLGQSAATAAAIALDRKLDVQSVDYKDLSERLLKDKQVLEWRGKTKANGVDPKALKGIVLDDDQAEKVGFAAASSSAGPYVGTSYYHDGDMDKGKQSAKYTPEIPEAGEYEVRVSYSPSSNRSTKVPVTVAYDGGEKTVFVNQKEMPKLDGAFVSLGAFKFAKGKTGSVTISNKNTTGHVIVDAVQFLRK